MLLDIDGITGPVRHLEPTFPYPMVRQGEEE